MGTSCQKIHILKKIRKELRKKIQEDTFNDPVSTPYGKANSSLRPDSFLKSLVILKMFALAALVQKFVRMTSDFKKLFTGPGKNYILLPSFSRKMGEIAWNSRSWENGVAWLTPWHILSHFPLPTMLLESQTLPSNISSARLHRGHGRGGGGAWAAYCQQRQGRPTVVFLVSMHYSDVFPFKLCFVSAIPNHNKLLVIYKIVLNQTAVIVVCWLLQKMAPPAHLRYLMNLM